MRNCVNEEEDELHLESCVFLLQLLAPCCLLLGLGFGMMMCCCHHRLSRRQISWHPNTPRTHHGMKLHLFLFAVRAIEENINSRISKFRLPVGLLCFNETKKFHQHIKLYVYHLETFNTYMPRESLWKYS